MIKHFFFSGLISVYLITASLLLILGKVMAESPTVKRHSPPVKAEFRVGAEYSDNLVVSAIDSTSRQWDIAAILDASIDTQYKIDNNHRLQFGYQYSQSEQREQAEFNLKTHYFSGEWVNEAKNKDKKSKNSTLTLGIPLRYFNAALDGVQLLTLEQIAPYASGFVSPRIFLRGEYLFSRKSFRNNPDRDNNQHRLGFHSYYFLNGVRRYWVVGYHYEREDAHDNLFDFRANSIQINFNQRFRVLDREWRLKLGYRWSDRRYQAENPLLGGTRGDRRQRAQASLRVPFGKQWFSEWRWQFQLSHSNLFAADYDQQRIGLYLGWIYTKSD